MTLSSSSANPSTNRPTIGQRCDLSPRQVPRPHVPVRQPGVGFVRRRRA